MAIAWAPTEVLIDSSSVVSNADTILRGDLLGNVENRGLWIKIERGMIAKG